MVMAWLAQLDREKLLRRDRSSRRSLPSVPAERTETTRERFPGAGMADAAERSGRRLVAKRARE